MIRAMVPTIGGYGIHLRYEEYRTHDAGHPYLHHKKPLSPANDYQVNHQYHHYHRRRRRRC